MYQPVGANLLRVHVLTPKKARYKTSPTNMHQLVGANLLRALTCIFIKKILIKFFNKFSRLNFCLAQSKHSFIGTKLALKPLLPFKLNNNIY